MIQTGKTSATIEITLTNTGPGAYRPETYGDSIKVVRTITQSSASSYKIKDSAGHTVSTRKSDLDQIISNLKIQVDNPVSVLNQDSAKDFLLQATPQKKYQLFMKATQLEIIGNNYREALATSQHSQGQLNETAERMHEESRKIQQLEQNIQCLDSIEEDQVQLSLFESEYAWACAIKEEAKLEKIEAQLAAHEAELEQFTAKKQDDGSRNNEIDKEIEESLGEIQIIEEKISGSKEKNRELKKASEASQHEYNEQKNRIKSIRQRINKHEENIKEFSAAVKRSIEGTGQAAEQRNQYKEQQARVQEEYDKCETLLNSRRVDMIHMEATKNQYAEKIAELNDEFKRLERNIKDAKIQLRSSEQQKGNSLGIYGPLFTRLMKRIEEDFNHGRIKKMPIGPVGAHIKMHDSQWTPAVEKLLGEKSMTTICVDNHQDAAKIREAMCDIYGDKNKSQHPSIYCSKFLDNIHNVKNTCARSSTYSNLLDTMEISSIHVTNYLIDLHGIEKILLIPTSRECSDILGHIQTVPQNCQKAITKTGDTFFPQPNYKTYGGKVGPKKWLQVSTTERIQSIKNELKNKEIEFNRIKTELHAQRQKYTTHNDAIANVNREIHKLKNSQTKLKSSIESFIDKINDIVETDENIDLWRGEITQLEIRIEQDNESEQQMTEQLNIFEINKNNANIALEKQQEIVGEFEKKIRPLEKKIRKLENEKSQLDINAKHANRQLEQLNRKLQEIKALVESQRRVTSKSVDDAQVQSQRIVTTRKSDDIKRAINQLKLQIETVRRKIGDRDTLVKQLDDLREKHGGVIEFFQSLTDTNKKHVKRVSERRKQYSRMKKEMGRKIEQAFAAILQLRGYKGFIEIDYRNKELTLDVTPQNTQERETNDAKTLSGGERSYSTVAFILALWECTSVPFYFMDEFDVFMDKVNRRMVMDCLLEHASTHRHCQFGFLTPLDASIVTAGPNLSIHRMAPPQRQATGGGDHQE